MRRFVSCDFNTPDGKVRRLNGGNLGPQLYPGSGKYLFFGISTRSGYFYFFYFEKYA